MKILLGFVLLIYAATASAQPAAKPRARDLGVPFDGTPGPLNAITDVAGVAVGQATVREGDSIRTGVTAVLPHGGNLFRERVPAAIHVGNGFGKLVGVTQVAELGELETPILLTCTLCVWKAADAMVAQLLSRPGMEEVRSINRSWARPTTATPSTPSGAGRSRSGTCGRHWRARREGPSRRAASGRGRERSRSDGRAGSARRRAG